MLNATFETRTSLFVSSHSDKEELAHATGFFTRYKDKLFLVSNWHVFSGRHCFSGQQLSDQVPQRLSVFLTEASHVVDNAQKSEVRIVREKDVPLYTKAGDSLWIQHPDGQELDLAAIEVPNWDGEVNDPLSEKVASRRLYCGDELTIVGYPFSLSVQGPSPVWMHATVASEPGYQVKRLPILLVDTNARGGMSGSPVYFRRRQSFHTILGDFFSRESGELIGVYSGRIGADLQLGRVIRMEEVIKMLSDPIPGRYRIINRKERQFPDARFP